MHLVRVEVLLHDEVGSVFDQVCRVPRRQGQHDVIAGEGHVLLAHEQRVVLQSEGVGVGVVEHIGDVSSRHSVQEYRNQHS